jgi:hypothetical protein
MSVVESVGLDAVTGALPFDATGIVQRVATRIFGQLLSEGVLPLDSGASAEDLIASSVGDWLTSAMRPDATPLAAGPIIEAEAADDDFDLDDLVGRNSELAAAVGACDCWGDDPGCAFCEGLGSAGWMPPDRQLFAIYVSPAVRSIRAARERRRKTSSRNNHRKGPDR